jgi:hypothetical protein
MLTLRYRCDLAPLGATRQSVNQELRRWEKAGLIRIGYGGVEIVDREALKREIAGG